MVQNDKVSRNAYASQKKIRERGLINIVLELWALMKMLFLSL